jgi:hypothetical protein
VQGITAASLSPLSLVNSFFCFSAGPAGRALLPA